MHFVIIILCVVVLKISVLYFGSNRKDWKKEARQARARASSSQTHAGRNAHKYTVIQQGRVEGGEDSQKRVVVIGGTSSLLAK
jgi:hypothetical protein